MIHFKIFKNENKIIHGILERKDGSVNPFSNIDSEKNILKAVKTLSNIEYKIDNLIYAEQIHKANIHITFPQVSGYIKLNVDGLISKNLGQILIIKTADCVPIMFYDKKNNIIANIHGGRKSLVANIIPKTLSLFKKNFGSDPNNILVGIGPHIRKCCYWLKDETYKQIKDTEWKKYFVEKENKIYFDLISLVIDKLKNSGIPLENIEDSNICTFDEYDRFFSARKREEQADIYQQENERFPCFGSFIGLK